MKPYITLSSPALSKKTTRFYWLRDIKAFLYLIFIFFVGIFWIFEVLLHMGNHLVGYYNIFIYFTLVYIFVCILIIKKDTWLYMSKYRDSIAPIIFLAFFLFTPIWTLFVSSNTFIVDNTFYPKVFMVKKKFRCDIGKGSRRVKRYCFDLKSSKDNVVFRVRKSNFHRYEIEDIITIKVEKSFLGFEIVKHFHIVKDFKLNDYTLNSYRNYNKVSDSYFKNRIEQELNTYKE